MTPMYCALSLKGGDNLGRSGVVVVVVVVFSFIYSLLLFIYLGGWDHLFNTSLPSLGREWH